MYTKKTLANFTNPKNYGKIKNPDGVGKVGNIVCGDVMYLYIKLDKEKKKIKDIGFETFGCVAAIATSSQITELAMGKTIEQALKISKSDVIDSLDGLPPVKIHCSVLAVDALTEAIYDYLQKNNQPVPENLAKRHEIIKKHKEATEERYKDWIGMEERIKD